MTVLPPERLTLPFDATFPLSVGVVGEMPIESKIPLLIVTPVHPETARRCEFLGWSDAHVAVDDGVAAGETDVAVRRNISLVRRSSRRDADRIEDSTAHRDAGASRNRPTL